MIIWWNSGKQYYISKVILCILYQKDNNGKINVICYFIDLFVMKIYNDKSYFSLADWSSLKD